MPASQYVRYELSGRVALITLNRPEARNAVNAAMARELFQAMTMFEADTEALVGVLTGAGPAFCAGLDLKAFLGGDGEEIVMGPEVAEPGHVKLTGVDMLGDIFRKKKPREPRRAGFAGFVRFPRTKPVLAAVNGPALAGGFELVLACDLCIASENAIFGLPEPKIGLFAGAGGAFRLPWRMAPGRAMEMLLTGDPIKAAEARDLGLVNHIYEPDRLLSEALILAGRMAEGAPFALKETYNLARAGVAQAKERIRKLEQALVRLENDPDFGLCADCGEPIAPARLMALPESELCVECAE